MQGPSAQKVASPLRGVSRVEDGRVKKLKASYKSEIPAVQNINGKTYACESCKRGHRVHKCDHGKTRPISETNQPGRPSAGQKRGCNCPRNCACTTKTCKCERDCACAQEAFLIVRLENPAMISMESTSTPKPVWEDAEGHQMTLKQVWADANGKEIDNEEYQARQRRMKEREDEAKVAPKSSCCGSGKPRDEPDSPKGGCRHRQNVAAIQPHPGHLLPGPPQQQLPPQSNRESWMATCSCGSGCSCLYCPDHPNNATSINHAQQQVKALTEQAVIGGHALTPVPSITDTTSRSCMGTLPTFFLSHTSDVSQQNFPQHFPDTMSPHGIYLAYPVLRHDWTNEPLNSHCSSLHSPPSAMTMSPGESGTLGGLLNDMPPSLHIPNEINGIWNFSSGQLGDNAFSWTELDASYGTDYNIGPATVASISNTQHPMFQALSAQPTPSTNVEMDAMLSPPLPNTFSDALPQLEENSYVNFDIPSSSNPSSGNIQANPFGAGNPSGFNPQTGQGHHWSRLWASDAFSDELHTNPEFNIVGMALPDSPIVNRV